MALKALTLPSGPTPTVTRLGTVWPGTKLRLETSGRESPDGQSVRKPAAVGSTTVTFITTAETPVAGTPPRPVIWAANVWPLPSGPGTPPRPRPVRVSRMRAGAIPVNSPEGSGAHEILPSESWAPSTVNHMYPSGPAAMSWGPASMRPPWCRVTVPVGPICSSASVPVAHTSPAGDTASASGSSSAVPGIGVTVPLRATRPTPAVPENHRPPSGPFTRSVAPCNSRAGNVVTTPAVVTRPSVPDWASTNHMAPSEPGASATSWADVNVDGNSSNVGNGVPGVMRPTSVPRVYQSLPSGPVARRRMPVSVPGGPL